MASRRGFLKWLPALPVAAPLAQKASTFTVTSGTAATAAPRLYTTLTAEQMASAVSRAPVGKYPITTTHFTNFEPKLWGTDIGRVYHVTNRGLSAVSGNLK